ncbi:hypothetical protein CASFOL_040883 [Castilleja foliolosa]|uniref:Gnk2-homologous domain-containing protein n=1 Tax=Castilleja foliolosa TaxID=1961234 RepID=A0ABD3BD38_9LAMI
MSYNNNNNNNNNNYLITTTILMITITVYHLLNIIPIAFSIDEDTELDYKCGSSDKNFTDSYKESRALVVTDVIVNTGSNEGFKKAWARDGEEWAYGQALCRGDVSPDGVCSKCVKHAHRYYSLSQ